MPNYFVLQYFLEAKIDLPNIIQAELNSIIVLEIRKRRQDT